MQTVNQDTVKKKEIKSEDIHIYETPNSTGPILMIVTYKPKNISVQGSAFSRGKLRRDLGIELYKELVKQGVIENE